MPDLDGIPDSDGIPGIDGIPDHNGIPDSDGIPDIDGIPDHNGIPDSDGIPDRDGIPDKDPHPQMGYQTGAHPPTPPNLAPAPILPDPPHPWLGCLIRCSFQSHLVWVQSHFTCSPPCEILSFTSHGKIPKIIVKQPNFHQ